MIELAKIRTDGGTQARAEIHEETVAEYAEAMQDPDTVFPPAIVYYDGKNYWLADGFHRVEAWRRVGRVEVPAEVRQGDRRRAILHSCAANAAHGLRRTNADKRRAVWTLLGDAEWGLWSNREIARRCGVSDPFVAKIRNELSANGLQIDGTRTVQRGGTTFEQNTDNIGKTKEDQEVGATFGTEENKGDEPQAIDKNDATGAAQSTPDQEQPLTHAEAEADAEAFEDGTDGGGDHSPAPVQEAEPTPDPYGYGKLTEEALLDLANGLRADLNDEKIAHAETKAKLKEVNEKLKNRTADDKDEVIRRLEAEVKNAGNAKWKALEDRDAYHRQVNALKKRVAELENVGVAY